MLWREVPNITTYEKILETLRDIEISVIEHAPTYTPEESALARGEDLSIGGKALLLKVGDIYGIFVLSAGRVIDNKKLKDYFKAKKVRFANNEELNKLTGLPTGAVPPFGRPIFDLNLYVDNSILENENIAFNAGSLTKSIKMKTQDYIKIANPVIISFSSKN